MTQEEREEAYNRARERIFGSSEKNGESPQGKSHKPDPFKGYRSSEAAYRMLTHDISR